MGETFYHENMCSWIRLCGIAHCLERVLLGRILIELIENTRIVGGYTSQAAYRAAEVYRKVVTREVFETSALSAEMSKLMENTYRDVNIALANELAKKSDKLGVDTLEVIQLANCHPRVQLHLPGPGVGGHCIPVDPYFIIEKATAESPLIAKAREINNSMPQFVVDHVAKIVEPQSKIAVMGLTYKGNTDDVGESPAMEIVRILKKEGYTLSLHDPHIRQDMVEFPLTAFEESITDAACILVLSDHKEFTKLDEQSILRNMKSPIVFDTKNGVRLENPLIQYYNFSNLFEMGRNVRTFT
jgi:UDP-N-acetyl-D-mannosaminuronic acid dehydrogenase